MRLIRAAALIALAPLAVRAAVPAMTPPGAELLGRFGLRAAEFELQVQTPDSAPAAYYDEKLHGEALFTRELWSRLPAAGADARAAAARLSWVDVANLRELTLPEAERLLDQGIARGYGLLDVFTDPGLNGAESYFISAATLRELDRRFELPTVCPIAGTDVKGKPFGMDAIVAGAKHADMLYDRDSIEYKNPSHPDYPFVFRSVVKQSIETSGSMGIEGITVNAGMFKPTIKRFVRVSPTRVRVETSMGNRETDAMPMRRR